MIAAYLVHSAQKGTANDALFQFGLIRTLNGKGALTNQSMYIYY